jgi:hypothetical protein
MRVSRIAIYALLLLVLVAGIGGWQYRQKYIYRQLEKIEELLQHQADSAWQILTKMEHPDRLYGRNRALYSLLYTQACYKNYIPVEGDSLIRFAVEYYSDTADSLRKSKSCFYMAQVCRDRYDRHRALDYFQKAGSAAKGCSEYKFLSLLYYHWGCLLQDEKPYRESLDKLLKAEYYDQLRGDTTAWVYSLSGIGWSYMLEKQYDSAYYCLSKAVQFEKKLKGDKELMSWLYYRLAILSYLQQEYISALVHLNKSYDVEDSERNKVNMMKGKIFFHLKRTDSTRYYMEKGKDESDIGTMLEYYRMASALEKQAGNFEKALEYHELYVNYVDSVALHKENERLMEWQKKYDYSLVQNENMYLKTVRQRKDIVLLLCVILLILLIPLFYVVYRKIKNNKEIVIREQNRLWQQRIQKKDSELRQAKQEISSKEQQWKEQALYNDELIKHIIELEQWNVLQKDKQLSKLILSLEELEHLVRVINDCYHHYTIRLQNEFPALKESDIYICCLLKIGIKNKDICYLLGITEETLKKRKYRIKHDKLKLDIALEDFLKSY